MPPVYEDSRKRSRCCDSVKRGTLLIIACIRSVCLRKLLEQAWLEVFRDARAAVANREADSVLAVLDRDGHILAKRRELDCIREQVARHLEKAIGVRFHNIGCRRRVEANAHVPGGGKRLVALNSLFEKGPKHDELAAAYTLFKRGVGIRQMVVVATTNAEPVTVPQDLEGRVRAYLIEHPQVPWDVAVAHIAGWSE